MSTQIFENYPLWAPLSELCDSALKLVDGVYSLGSGWYALTNSAFGGTEVDPGVGGILWACSEATALRVTGHLQGELTTEERGDFNPVELGIARTFGEIVRSEKLAGRRPQQNAAYAYGSGDFRCSEVDIPAKRIYFKDPNPRNDDEPIAVLFRLTKK